MNAILKLLRRPAVQDRINCGKTKLYGMIAAGEFPAPIKSAAHRSGPNMRSTPGSRPGSRSAGHER